MRRIIESGKHKGSSLDECPESYLKWLISHERVLALRNRWMSRDARFILVQRAEAAAILKAEAEMAVLVAQEIVHGNQNWDDWAGVLTSKEKEMLKAVRATIGKRQIFEWQESLQKTILANRDTDFTADEMYAALESVCREGEDLDSKRDVTEYLDAMVRMPFAPIRLQKDGESYKLRV